MAEFKIVHFKTECISCGACAAICPKFWKIDSDGFADLVGGVKTKDHFELELENDSDKAACQEAADCCPVNSIHIERIV